MWTLGWQETVFIFLLALLIFGPKKLPELGKTIAKGLAEFRRAWRDHQVVTYLQRQAIATCVIARRWTVGSRQ